MHKVNKRLIFLITMLLWSFTAWGCAGQEPVPSHETIWPGIAWPTSSPEMQQMDGDLLDQMMDSIDARESAIDSVLVIRNGYLVYEQYRRNWQPDSRHHIQSVTKSFTSTLVGIAIKEGFIEDVDQSIMDFFPGVEVANLDSRKQGITIKHLLTMSEGMEWHEIDLPYDHPDNTLGQMWEKADVIQHVLDQPMLQEPGQTWNYNSGTSMLLGNIVERASGQDIFSFADQYLFGPLGITDVTWQKADRVHYHTDGGLYMLPRDMARLGYLMLQDGSWNGKQILPSGWVQDATTPYFTTPGGMGYGYQWWISPQIEIFSARGHYDQAIYVVPEADLVVVFTANIPDEAIHPEDALLIRYILGSCQDLPADFTRQSFTNYGFEMDHGGEFQVLEIPDPILGPPSETAGIVQFITMSYPVELVIVSWDKGSSGQDPEDLLYESLEEVQYQSGLAIDPGGISYLKIRDRRIPSLRIFFEEGDLAFSGVSGVWSCSDSQRRYHLTYLSDGEEGGRFEEIFGSFQCQE